MQFLKMLFLDGIYYQMQDYILTVVVLLDFSHLLIFALKNHFYLDFY